MDQSWDHPLDGLDDIPWADMRGPDDAAELVAALRFLAEEGGSDHRILGVLEDRDNDFRYATMAGRPEGLRPAAATVLRFLARIAAQPSGVGSSTAMEIIETILEAELDRPTMTDDELDAMVDGLRAELDAARPALAEAGRLDRHSLLPMPQLLESVDEGERLGGAYEPRWRGVARPLAGSLTGRLVVAGGMLITRESSGLVFRSLDDGTPVHEFGYPGPQEAWPFAGFHAGPGPRLSEAKLWAVPFADGEGPGVLTAEAGQRDARLWRRDGTGWQAIPLVRPGLRLRSAARRVDAIAAHGGTCLVGYGDNLLWSFDARSGTPTGDPIVLPREARHLAADHNRVTVVLQGRDDEPNVLRIDRSTGRPVKAPVGPAGTLPVQYQADDRRRLVFTSGTGAWRKLHRVDADSGAEIGEPLMVGDLNGFCVYQVGRRPCLAVGGLRQVHRFDAETGEPIGTPLFGHRRIVLDLVSAVVDGRPALYSADGATVRRWDAETGIPWPAPLPG
ncbi:hypothetical protein [Actinoplanes xinjiangensis]|uniref:hypothetical protein n=1 Tax=Actinoplanes xinjiangensis TaxID=512350 RepID=UPI003424F987